MELLYIPLALVILGFVIFLGNKTAKDKPATNFDNAVKLNPDGSFPEPKEEHPTEVVPISTEPVKTKYPFWTIVFSNLAVLVLASFSFVFIMYATKCELTDEQLKIVQRTTIECVENGGENCAKKAEKEVCNLIDLTSNVKANY